MVAAYGMQTRPATDLLNGSSLRDTKRRVSILASIASRRHVADYQQQIIFPVKRIGNGLECQTSQPNQPSW